MATITADPNMLAVLSQVKEATEIRGPDGNLLGTFLPENSAQEKELYEKAKQILDPAELEQRKREEAGKGSSLEEMWKRIHAKETRQ